MKAIEIYAKILDIIKDENHDDVHAALHFVMMESEKRQYRQYEATRKEACSSGLGSFTGTCEPTKSMLGMDNNIAQRDSKY